MQCHIHDTTHSLHYTVHDKFIFTIIYNYDQAITTSLPALIFISEVNLFTSIIFIYIYFFFHLHIFRLLDDTAKRQQLGEVRSMFPAWPGVMLPTYSYFMMKVPTCWRAALSTTVLSASWYSYCWLFSSEWWFQKGLFFFPLWSFQDFLPCRF